MLQNCLNNNKDSILCWASKPKWDGFYRYCTRVLHPLWEDSKCNAVLPMHRYMYPTHDGIFRSSTDPLHGRSRIHCLGEKVATWCGAFIHSLRMPLLYRKENLSKIGEERDGAPLYLRYKCINRDGFKGGGGRTPPLTLAKFNFFNVKCPALVCRRQFLK